MATLTRIFGLCIADIGQRVVMPKLLDHLSKVAPGVRIVLSYTSEQTARSLESGEVDVAIGFLAQLDGGFFQQKLFDDRFIWIVNKKHTRRRGTEITLDQFQEESHLIVSTHGPGHVIVEQTLEGNGIRRKVGLRIPNFLGVVSSIASTEYLAIVPERFARIIAQGNQITVMELPFAVPRYRVMQHRHERYSKDPAVIWLSNTIGTLFWE